MPGTKRYAFKPKKEAASEANRSGNTKHFGTAAKTVGKSTRTVKTDVTGRAYRNRAHKNRAYKNGSFPAGWYFYAAPAEDAEPFVQEGDGIEKGQTLGIVEAMKLMNELESDYCGTVKQILVSNGEMVEYGQPLFIVEEQN